MRGRYALPQYLTTMHRAKQVTYNGINYSVYGSMYGQSSWYMVPCDVHGIPGPD